MYVRSAEENKPTTKRCGRPGTSAAWMRNVFRAMTGYMIVSRVINQCKVDPGDGNLTPQNGVMNLNTLRFPDDRNVPVQFEPELPKRKV